MTVSLHSPWMAGSTSSDKCDIIKIMKIDELYLPGLELQVLASASVKGQGSKSLTPVKGKLSRDKCLGVIVSSQF